MHRCARLGYCRFYSARFPQNICKSSQRQMTMEPHPIHVLYGSQTGTAQYLADTLSTNIKEKFGEEKVKLEISCLNDFGKRSDVSGAKDSTLLILISNFGKGEPPDNAKTFYEDVVETMPPEKTGGANGFPNVSYAIFGLGNSTYTGNYQNTARKLDSALKTMGIFSVCPRGEGDDAKDIEGMFEDWEKNTLFPALEKKLSSSTETESTTHTTTAKEPPSSPDISVKSVITEEAKGDFTLIPRCGSYLSHPTYEDKTSAETVYNQDYPKFCNLIGSQYLCAPGSRIQVKLLEFDTEGSLPYKVGDYLGIWPKNDPKLVDQLLTLLNIDETQSNQISIDCTQDRKSKFSSYMSWPCPSIREFFEERASLTNIPRKPFFKLLAQYSKNETEKSELNKWAASSSLEIKNRFSGYTLVDFLLEFPNSIPPAISLISSVAPMNPRFYSIASSPLIDNTKVGIVVGRAKCFRNIDNQNENLNHTNDIYLKQKEPNLENIKILNQTIDSSASKTTESDVNPTVNHNDALSINEVNISISPGELEYITGINQKGFPGVCSNFLHNLGSTSSSPTEGRKKDSFLPNEISCNNKTSPSKSTGLFIISASSFWLPLDNGVPIILCGAGTGFAPFRGFLQERSYLKSSSRNHDNNTNTVGEIGDIVLLMGLRTKEDAKGFFSDWLHELHQSSVLTKYLISTSHDERIRQYNSGTCLEKLPPPGPFIHHSMIQDPTLTKTIFELLMEKKGHIYICGHRIFGDTMISSFGHILARNGVFTEEEKRTMSNFSASPSWGPSPKEGRLILDDLERTGRLHVDVFE